MKSNKNRNLIPHFILKQFVSEQYFGNFRAIIIYADITGIAKLIDHMLLEGKAGAAVLSQELEFLFEEMNKEIYLRGGFVGDYHGDAFAAYFPIINDQSATWERARAAADGLLSFFAKKGNRHTKLGTYALNVKIGMGIGNVEWGIVGENKQFGWYFRGNGLAQAVQAEGMAEIGRLYIPGELQGLGPARNFDEDEIERKEIDIPLTAISNFYSPDILNFEWGDIRNIVALSIRFIGALDYDKLNELYAIASRFGNRYGGYVNNLEFHGKPRNLLVIFGFPFDNGDILRRALSYVTNFKAAIERGVLPVQLKAAIAASNAFCGFRGGELRAEPVCIGPAIGFADILLRVAEPDNILMPEELANATNNFANVSLVAKKNFRGIKNTVAYFKLDNLQNLADGLGMTEKLKGRSNELSFLKKEIKQKFEKRAFGGVILVRGDEGIGKSHLVYSLRQILEEEKIPHHWVYLRNDPLYPQPYGGFVRFFYRYFRQERSKRQAENKASFLQVSSELMAARTMPAKLKAGLQHNLSFLSELIGLKWPDSVAALTTEEDKYKDLLYKTIKAFFVALSFKIPVVIHIENADSLDKETMEFLPFLLQNMQNVPITIIATARGDESPEWYRELCQEYQCREIVLKTLEDKYIDGIAYAEIGNQPSKTLREYLYKIPEYNPMKLLIAIQTLKLLELIKMDLVNNLADLSADQKAIPDTIEKCLNMQIEKIPKKLLNIIKQSAAISDWFPVYLFLYTKEETELIDKDLLLQCERYNYFMLEKISVADEETYLIYTSNMIRKFLLSKIPKKKLDEMRNNLEKALKNQ